MTPTCAYCAKSNTRPSPDPLFHKAVMAAGMGHLLKAMFTVYFHRRCREEMRRKMMDVAGDRLPADVPRRNEIVVPPHKYRGGRST